MHENHRTSLKIQIPKGGTVGSVSEKPPAAVSLGAHLREWLPSWPSPTTVPRAWSGLSVHSCPLITQTWSDQVGQAPLRPTGRELGLPQVWASPETQNIFLTSSRQDGPARENHFPSNHPSCCLSVRPYSLAWFPLKSLLVWLPLPMKEKPFPVWFGEVCGPECSPCCGCLFEQSFSLPKSSFVFIWQCPQPLTEPQVPQKKESAATFWVLLCMQQTGWGFEPIKSHGCHPRSWVFAGAHCGPFWSQLQGSFLASEHQA